MTEHLWAKIDNNRIWENRTVKLLGIIVDNELKIDEHLSNVCLKVNKKLSSLTRIRKYLDFRKIKILFEGFFEAQYRYCPVRRRFIVEVQTGTELQISIELYKVYYDLPQTIFSNVFTQKSHSYNLCSKVAFAITQILYSAVLKGSNSIRYYGSIIWSTRRNKICRLFRKIYE